MNEGANTPPSVVAAYGSRTITLTDEDPALANLRRASIDRVQWKDRLSRTWNGGLMRPHGASRAPLVVLIYEFNPHLFMPDGCTTTAFAAQALASRGMAVLQMPRGNSLPVHDLIQPWTSGQGPGFVEGLDAAVEFLAQRGWIDPQRVGIVGFSQTSTLVTYAITHPGRTKLRAAIAADGGDSTYLNYLIGMVNSPGSIVRMQSVEGFVGSDGTFWDDRETWLEQQPGFNLHRVSAPLLLTVNGKHNALALLEIYAGLRILGKPVEFLMVPQGGHQLRRPRERIASMGATVDWMAYWLHGTEDADRSKSAQYERWRALREPQPAATAHSVEEGRSELSADR